MSRRALLATLLIAAAAMPAAGAYAASHKQPHKPRYPRGAVKGDLLVIFRGAGGGSYRYHEPAAGAGAACRSPDTTYSETDSYEWDYRFIVPPGGGASDAPVQLAGGGEINATEVLAQCAGAAALTSTCTQPLDTPPASDTSDIAYPNVVVGAGGGLITVGALGELLSSASQVDCTGLDVLAPNPVVGFAQLQANVSLPSAELYSRGAVTRHFTMAGSGLYDGISLSGSCDSTGCSTDDCADDGGVGGGPPTSCSFQETYSGTIEVEVVR